MTNLVHAANLTSQSDRHAAGAAARSSTSRASARYASAPRDFTSYSMHRHAVARRLAEPDVARDDGAKHFLLEELADVGRDLLPEIRPLVEHRQQHAFDVERRIERRAHAAHRADEIGEPFEREVLAVQRNQHGVGGDERVQRQQAERRRTVDEDVVELVAQRLEQRAQPLLAVRQRDQLDFGAGEIAVGGNQRQAIDAGRDDEAARRRSPARRW